MRPATLAASSRRITTFCPEPARTTCCNPLKFQLLRARLAGSAKVFWHWRIECNRSGGTPMQVDAIFIPAETPVASNASRPSSPAALSFGATLASSISSSAPPNLEGPIKHQSADGQSVKGQLAQRQSAQSQSDQARSEQDLSVIDRVAAQSGAAASVESKSSLPVAPGLSVTSGPTLISNLNSNSAIKAAAKLAPRSPVSPTATGVVPAASFPAFELLGPFTPVRTFPILQRLTLQRTSNRSQGNPCEPWRRECFRDERFRSSSGEFECPQFESRQPAGVFFCSHRG